MKKFKCNDCVHGCVVIMERGEKCPLICEYNKAKWHEVKEETSTDCNSLPKLTAEVFDRPDCPEWADYAFVNSYGHCVVLEVKPKITEHGSLCAHDLHHEIMHQRGRFKRVIGEYIERPWKKALPDWCKVGAICYDYGAEHYFEVTRIDDEKAEVSISWYPKGLAEVISYSLFTEYARPARKHCFNEHEMLDLVGKVLSAPSGEWRSSILWASGDEVVTHYREYNANALMDGGYTINGEPCYVLEHLNEKGEWVK